MNRKISIAVGTAAAVAFTGAAFASDLVTINSSEGYTTVGSEAFMPGFLRADCGHQDGTATYAFISGSCPEHGQTVVSLAANGGFWDGGDAVPVYETDALEASGYSMLKAPNGDVRGDAFDNGLFRTNDTSYFSGLSYGWDTLGDALGVNAGKAPDAPMGGPTGTDANVREFWVDQTVIGYVETLRDTDGNQGNGGEAETTLAMNFRTSLTFTGSTDLTGELGVSNHIDQRLEQMVELVDGSNNPNAVPGMTDPAAFEASRQTLQQAFALDAGSGIGSANNTTDPDANADLHEENMGQLVAQDIEGFFFSCLSCDTAALETLGGSHAFTPEAIDAHYMPYVAGWQTVPTVIHAP
jgi:hypothetical protein